jgi:hypothetical protein
VVEFFPIDGSLSKRQGKWEIISFEAGTYGQGVKQALQAAFGIYVFYDSRGRAIYAGKAVDQPLWKELNSAYNRDRGDLQKVRLVGHPERNVPYRPYDEKVRQPVDWQVPLYDIAEYFSAYAIEPTDMIGMFEALIVRAFANDLLNKKMEKF